MKIKFFLPAIVWAIFILLVSLVPESKIPVFSWFKFNHADKIIHFVMYFVFAFLISAGFFIQKSCSQRKAYFISLAVTLFFAILTEILQKSFISSRSGDLEDFIANVLGMAAGIVTGKLLSGTLFLKRFV